MVGFKQVSSPRDFPTFTNNVNTGFVRRHNYLWPYSMVHQNDAASHLRAGVLALPKGRHLHIHFYQPYVPILLTSHDHQDQDLHTDWRTLEPGHTIWMHQSKSALLDGHHHERHNGLGYFATAHPSVGSMPLVCIRDSKLTFCKRMVIANSAQEKDSNIDSTGSGWDSNRSQHCSTHSRFSTEQLRRRDNLICTLQSAWVSFLILPWNELKTS